MLLLSVPAPAAADPQAVAPWLTFANGDDVRRVVRVDGALWAATQAGGAVRWDGPDRYRQYLFPQDGLASNDVRDIVAHAGATWFATSRGLSRLAADGRWTTYTAANTGGGLPSDDVTALASGPDGSLWVGTRQRWTGREWTGGGLARLRDGQWQIYTPTDGVASLNISGLSVTPAGEVWAIGQPYRVWVPPADPAPGFYQATGGGASVLRQDGWAVYRRDEANAGALPNTNTFHAMASNGDGRLWFATSAGLLMFGPRGWRAWTVTGGGEAANGVTALAVDTSGRVWLAVTDPSGVGLALSVLDTHGTPDDPTDDTWRHLPTTSLPASTIQSILPESEGAGPGGAWLGLRETTGNGGGLARVTPDGVVAERRLTTGLTSNFISALTIAPDGSLWIGTGGVEAQGRGRGLNIVHPDGSWSQVRSERLATMAAASLSRPAQRDDAEIYTRWPSLAAAQAALASGRFALGDDPTRYTLVGLYTLGSEIVLQIQPGLSRDFNAGASLYPVELNLGSDNIAGVAFDPTGAAWVASRSEKVSPLGTGYTDGGLARYTDRWQVQRASPTGLPSNNLSVVAVAADGRVWVGTGSLGDSTGSGLAVLQPGTGEWTRYTTREGLLSDLVTGLVTTPQGEVWLTSAPSWLNGSRQGGGVSRWRDGAWTHWTPTTSPLVADFADARAIGRDRKGGIWVGGWHYEGPSLLADWPAVQAVANRFAGGDWLAWTFSRAGWTTSFAAAPDGRLWVGTSRGGYEPDPATGGVWVLDGSNWLRVDTSLGLADNDVQVITIAPDGVVWIGTVDHGLTRYNPAVAPLPTPPLPTPTPLATPGPTISQIYLPLVSK
ncbi:MAG: hypothetical protein KIT87_15020 [Anaerolineae bacterium]|nr:hypothetical protein [Anaerolineae bacterium]